MAKIIKRVDSAFHRLMTSITNGVIFVLLVSFFLAVPSQPVFAQDTGSITGTVRGPDNNLLAGATVAISNPSSITLEGGLTVLVSGTSYSTTSGADGTYTISGVPAGSYRVQASASGCATQFYYHSYDYFTAPTVTVASGGTTSGINFDLVAGGTITGTIMGPGGTPAAGASVHAANMANSPFLISGIYNADNGTYTITGLPAGNYYVGASGSGLARKYYNDVTSYISANAVAVSSGGTTPNINFNLVVIGDPTTGTITGTITGPGGTPATGVSVYASGPSWGSTTSAVDGTYTITGLPSGSYTVYAFGSGWAAQYYNLSDSFQSATAVAVTNGGTTPNINFNLVAGGTITGIVMANGSPLSGESVYASNTLGNGVGNGTTSAADGTYTITGLPAGSYRVQTYGSGWAAQYYNLSDSYQSATAVAVASGGTASGINFNLVAGSTITGTVMANGSPLSGASVYASNAVNGAGNGTTSAADGTYTITGLPAGSYTVQAYGSGWLTQYYNLAGSSQSATAVAVASGGTASNVNFNLVAGGTITGIAMANGNPLAGASVSASNTVSGVGVGTTSAANGTYTITGLLPGSYLVTIRYNGWVTQYYNLADISQSATAVTVTSGGTTPDINFNLVTGGTIRGTVMENGSPLAGVMVYASNTNTVTEGGIFVSGNMATTAADGTYTITGLLPGSYLLNVRDSMMSGFTRQYYNHAVSSSTATSVVVTSGGTTSSIDFDLVAGGTITGTVMANSSPLGSASISATNTVTGQSCSVPSGIDGTYTITGIPAGSYYVGAGGMQFSPQFYNNAVSTSTATKIAVTSGETISNIDFNLVEVEGGGTIQGRITLRGGLPCQSCYVVVLDARSTSGRSYSLSASVTSSDGSYEIPPLPAGTYKIGAISLSLMQIGIYSYHYWPATTNIDSAVLVPVTAGQVTENMNIEINPFIFTDQTGVARSTVITSNSIFAVWINTDADISITGGEYSLNGGAYTSASGMISPGNSVQVRQTSSASYGTTTNATLTIGAISDTFSVTTIANTAPVIPTPPTGGIQGTSITINGSNFGAVQGGSYVNFNGVQGTVGYWSDTRIVVIVPPGATSGPMRVVTSQGTSSSVSFTVYAPECAAPIKVAGSNYFTIQDAYNSAVTGSTLQITEGLFNTGYLVFNRNISTRVTGGYNCGYDTKTGYSTVDGTVIIKGGAVTVERLIIK